MTRRAKSAQTAESIRTLQQAHAYLGPRRPVESAPALERVAFFRESARIYAAVAEIDRFHHHEALYWATREREHAQAAQAQLDRGRGVVPSARHA
ncbi:AMED_5909 family protein [Actinokineospora spheciospongiae]|uniref:AMED_5909 family protein n=1 Tax=Actinokineospora spheciospongiae TaxID=909613 RepID=UPI000D709484|nr:AMED_5909 family protein [Actinokineospora spheciospongiae]PWW62135.1 hypothetical protein DFQ13_106389 [Actinokineospora spheciospongiae]